MERLDIRRIDTKSSLITALRQMDYNRVKLLFAFNEDFFVGLLTIGDIQRAIIRGVQLSTSISEIIDKEKIYAHHDESEEQIKSEMARLRAECMPVIDDDGRLVKI